MCAQESSFECVHEYITVRTELFTLVCILSGIIIMHPLRSTILFTHALLFQTSLMVAKFACINKGD